MINYFDTHCHLNSAKFDGDRDLIVKNASEANVKIIDIATDLKSSKISAKYKNIYHQQVFSTVGFHPEEAEKNSNNGKLNLEKLANSLETLITESSPVAIGECGMDYYWLKVSGDTDAKSIEKKIRLQHDVFEAQVKLAKKLNLPIIIHTRAFPDDLERIVNEGLNILSNYGYPSGIFHSFTGDFKHAKLFLEQGYYISFNGIMTFKKSDEIRELFKLAFERYPRQIVFETDSPYLAPEGKRGKRNKPVNVIEVYKLANEVIGKDISELINQNVAGLFNLN